MISVLMLLMLQVGWGESTMIEAVILLLQLTIENPTNQRFVRQLNRQVGISLKDSCYKKNPK